MEVRESHILFTVWNPTAITGTAHGLGPSASPRPESRARPALLSCPAAILKHLRIHLNSLSTMMHGVVQNGKITLLLKVKVNKSPVLMKLVLTVTFSPKHGLTFPFGGNVGIQSNNM